jgi:uncharacterized sporulation protein YeaH/YhbH (DUF444 family)
VGGNHRSRMGKKGKRPSDGGQQGGEGKKRKKGNGAAEGGELSELEQQISKDSQALDVLIGMIPAEHYKAPDPDKKAAMSAKYMKKDKTHVSANRQASARCTEKCTYAHILGGAIQFHRGTAAASPSACPA